MASTTSRGNRLSYTTHGAGPPVVLIPGLTMRAAQWIEHGYVDALAADFRLVCIDPLGHGDSEKPHEPDAYRTPDVVADVLAVLDAEGIDAAAWWGFSRGGSIGVDAALLHPERVRALVIGDAPIFRGETSHPGIAQYFASDEALRSLWTFMGVTDPARLDAFGAVNDVAALRAAYRGATGPLPDIATIPIPMMAYRQFTPASGDWMTAFLAANEAPVHAVAATSHMAAFEQSRDVLVATRPFLDRHA